MESVPINGDSPQQRFGHTMTMISKTKAILFGGAVSTEGTYKITNDTFLFDSRTMSWTRLFPQHYQQKAPCARAAHAAASVEEMQIVIYGGAIGHGTLADDDLYLLKSAENGPGSWVKVPVEGQKPGPRYGHVIAYFKPYIVIFGGNTGNEPFNDVWGLNVDQQPFNWTKINTTGKTPRARVYHSGCIWRANTKMEMLLIFGGRAGNGDPLNDLWGLRRHNNGDWDWIEAPYKSNCEKPGERYQHSSLCLNNIFIVVGGRDSVQERNLNIELFNLDTSEWYRLGEVNRFRHTSWICQGKLFIHGGFEPKRPSTPTSDLFVIDLASLFKQVPALPSNISFSDENQSAAKTNKNLYPLSYQAIIANAPGEDNQRFVQKKPINKLERESLRLTAVGQNISNQQSVYHDSLYSVLLKHLLLPGAWVPEKDYSFGVQRSIVIKLCDEVIKILKKSDTVLKVRPPVKIFGSIHGQYADLMRMFEAYGVPDDSPEFNCDIEGLDYLFLGNYVDRGKYSLEVICLLFALKVKFPEQIHLLRGSHEDIRINSVYGFADECQTRFKENPQDPNSIFRKINEVFEYLPLAAVVAGAIFCVHSGIGSTMNSIDEISQIKRPLSINYEGSTTQQKIILDLLWSDPVQNESEKDTRINESRDFISQGKIVTFGTERINTFMTNNRIGIIIRSKECVMDGIEKFSSSNLFTVFSCTNYGGKYNNQAALLIVKKNWSVVDSKQIEPDGSNEWMQLDGAKSKVGYGDSALRNRPVTPPRQYHPK